MINWTGIFELLEKLMHLTLEKNPGLNPVQGSSQLFLGADYLTQNGYFWLRRFIFDCLDRHFELLETVMYLTFEKKILDGTLLMARRASVKFLQTGHRTLFGHITQSSEPSRRLGSEVSRVSGSPWGHVAKSLDHFQDSQTFLITFDLL